MALGRAWPRTGLRSFPGVRSRQACAVTSVDDGPRQPGLSGGVVRAFLVTVKEGYRGRFNLRGRGSPRYLALGGIPIISFPNKCTRKKKKETEQEKKKTSKNLPKYWSAGRCFLFKAKRAPSAKYKNAN